MDNYEQPESPSFWPSVLIGAFIVSIVSSVLGLFLAYYIAGSEPSMTMLAISGLSVPITCLFGLIGGIIASRHYAKTYEITFLIGKGALIGLYTGVLAAVLSTVITQLWYLVDPTLPERFSQAMISVFEQMEMPAAQKEETLSQMQAQFESQQSFGAILQGLAINAGILGFVNVISGMIGAKIFASED